MNKIANYTTNDLYLAAVLKTLQPQAPQDIAFVGIFGNDNKKQFGFSVNEDNLALILDDYYNKSLSVDAKTYVETLKELRERVLNVRG